MLNWIIFIVIYILYIEVMKYLDNIRNKNNKDIGFLSSEIKRIKTNHSTTEDNILYLKYKNDMKRLLGGGVLHIIIMIAGFILFLILYKYVETNILDSAVLAFNIAFVFALLSANLIKSVDKVNMFYKDFFSDMFIFSFIIINTHQRFTIGNFGIGFIFMLPILLVIKIVYNNLKRGIIKWSQR